MTASVDEPAPAGAEIFGMTDLEEALWGAEGRAVQAAVIERLAALSTTVQAMIVGGLSPKDFSCATAIAIALATSREFMLARV